jgi:hypothetical protein
MFKRGDFFFNAEGLIGLGFQFHIDIVEVFVFTTVTYAFPFPFFLPSFSGMVTTCDH